MFNILEKIKLKRIKEIEQTLKECIEFNKYKYQCYKNYPDVEIITLPNFKGFNDSAIARGFHKSVYDKEFRKLGVSKELWDEHLESYSKAMEEYYKLEKRIKQEKNDKELREKIDLYKKAILELKQEGLI